LKKNLLTPFREALGFAFTRAQKRVIREIFADMQGPHPMNRLLQGDVGSGKTVVAASALLLAVENGHQGALMAPTEILAEQHYLTFLKLMRGLGVRVELLTSKLKGRTRARVLGDLAAGRVNLAIGTHALLDEDVRFESLSLVVVDEQHRFGVRQRTVLRLKGRQPDLLVMTATPIPRTLALTLYGDLDVSTLDELPPGRRPVETRHVPERAAFEHLSRQVEAGHQAFVVYPVIEESSRAELKAASLEKERLEREVFPRFRLGLLHGQMAAAQKDEVMEAFARGEFQVLVTTPVVEVGVDVPNATVMVVQHAERFGLASLHQLRGRVGRSHLPSWCFLVGDPATPAAQGRIEVLCRTHDGFEISERDLKLRGPGEMLGVEQHGPLALKVGDLAADLDLIRIAREDGERLLAEDPALVRPEHRALRERLIDQYARRWRWIDLS
jgi:ATP-dependent DNA helicase RecG